MQMVRKILLGIFVTWFALLVFMPKTELYYALEEKLAEKEIKLNEENIDEGVFTLSVDGIDIYVKGIKVATIKKLDFFTMLFYTHVNIEELIVDKLLQNKAPKMAEKVDVSYSVLSPLSLNMEANGSFGIVEGQISFSKHIIHIVFIEAKEISTIQSFLKKDEKGWYYEKSF